ncbi:MAG: hypothetical protein HKO07_06545 [Pseudomonadales bacterium]|nr:hypothetical protein [Pseudomonadales bacterium]
MYNGVAVTAKLRFNQVAVQQIKPDIVALVIKFNTNLFARKLAQIFALQAVRVGTGIAYEGFTVANNIGGASANDTLDQRQRIVNNLCQRIAGSIPLKYCKFAGV